MSSKDQVIQILSNQLNFDTDTIKTNQDLVKDLKMDSLDVAEIIMSVEEQFSISLPDEEAEKLKTVQDVINYVDKHQKS